jgi:hypothetical protein
MRLGVLVLAGLALARPLRGQQASADSAAIVALEFEMSRLLVAGQVEEYATHLTADYARTTRQGTLERRDVAQHKHLEDSPCLRIEVQSGALSCYQSCSLLAATRRTSRRPGPWSASSVARLARASKPTICFWRWTR